MVGIRRARKGEQQKLTHISKTSKAYWKYPESYFQIWHSELTISEEYIVANRVFVYQDGEMLCGYYSLVTLVEDTRVAGISFQAGVWLDHMFVLPEYIGRGIGGKLFGHCRMYLKDQGIERLHILSDPHAAGFYIRMGCRLISQMPSTIEGRTTPYLEYRL